MRLWNLWWKLWVALWGPWTFHGPDILGVPVPAADSYRHDTTSGKALPDISRASLNTTVLPSPTPALAGLRLLGLAGPGGAAVVPDVGDEAGDMSGESVLGTEGDLDFDAEFSEEENIPLESVGLAAVEAAPGGGAGRGRDWAVPAVDAGELRAAEGPALAPAADWT